MGDSYGLINGRQLAETAKYICDILGHGKNKKAVFLLIETAGAETAGGETLDKTKYAGIGLTQIDKVAFDDVKDRIRAKDVKTIQEKMGININWIEWEHLRYNPLLALLFTRLIYKKIPEEIPNTKAERAEYWKKYYNTEAGKGTLAHYIRENETEIV